MRHAAIDISHHNNITGTNWWDNQLDLVIMKTSEGNIYRDPTYAKRSSELYSHRVNHGAYHYAQGGEVQAEVINFTGALTGYETMLALDVEESFPNMENWCLEWLDNVKMSTGKPVYIYMNQTFLRRYKWGEIARKYPLWYARPNSTPGNTGDVTPWKTASIHQYSFSGRIDGIAGNVDLNYLLDTIAEMVTTMDREDKINVRTALRPNPDRTITVEQWMQEVFNMLTVLVRDKDK